MLILGNSGSSRIHLRENASLSILRTITRYCDSVVGDEPKSLKRLTSCCTASVSTKWMGVVPIRGRMWSFKRLRKMPTEATDMAPRSARKPSSSNSRSATAATVGESLTSAPVTKRARLGCSAS